MKKLNIIFLAFATGLIIVSGCKKDKTETNPSIELTTDEAANVVATSMCTDNSGTTAQMEDAIDLSEMGEKKAPEDWSHDSTFSITNPAGSIFIYTYDVYYHYGLTLLPTEQFFFDYTLDGNFSGPVISSTSSSDGNLNITGLEASSTSYIFNGDALITGTFASKIGNKQSFNADASLTFTDVKYSKTDYVIESGTADVMVTGTTSTGLNFSFSGTLVYNGGHSGTLTLNNTLYNINLTTGTIEQVN